MQRKKKIICAICANLYVFRGLLPFKYPATCDEKIPYSQFIPRCLRRDRLFMHQDDFALCLASCE